MTTQHRRLQTLQAGLVLLEAVLFETFSSAALVLFETFSSAVLVETVLVVTFSDGMQTNLGTEINFLDNSMLGRGIILGRCPGVSNTLCFVRPVLSIPPSEYFRFAKLEGGIRAVFVAEIMAKRIVATHRQQFSGAKTESIGGQGAKVLVAPKPCVLRIFSHERMLP